LKKFTFSKVKLNRIHIPAERSAADAALRNVGFWMKDAKRVDILVLKENK
jgi:hypothetical protein